MIDERIVQMVFNNQQFEKGVQTSIGSLNQLDKSLRLDGAGKGLQDLDAAARRFSLAGLTDGVDFIASKFSMMGMVGMRAMQQIADTAINTGKKMINAFTIDPVKTGFQEYETQINAVQTILANTESKGTTIDDVNRALDELNTYADKTIYNFTQMTRNIGTFTAAGLDLKTSTAAIQGIANLAAVSGSNAQQASTAMYQLSQALSSGTVKLQDWNSVVNAGMGGQVFQDALKKTAAHMNEVAESVKKMSADEKAAWAAEKGYNEDQMRRVENYNYDVDALIKKTGSFRESLSSGWITAEVLSETLNKMTKTGVAEYLAEVTGVTQEHIEAVQKDVGACKDGTKTYADLATEMAASGKITKEEAESLLKMADTAENAATKVKTFSQLLDTLKEAAQSGWTQSWEYIIGDFEEAKELLTEISDIFGEIINKSSEERNSVLLGWKEAGGRDDLIQGFRNILDFVTSISAVAERAYKSLFPGNRFLGLNTEGLTAITKKFADMTSNLKMSGTSVKNLRRVFDGLASVLAFVGDAASAFLGALGKVFGMTSGISGGLLEIAASVGDYLTQVYKGTDWTEKFAKAFDILFAPIRAVIGLFRDLVKSTAKSNAVGRALSSLGKGAEWASKKFSKFQNGMTSAIDAISKSKFGDVMRGIRDSFKNFDGLGKISELFTSIGDSISNVATAISNSKFGQSVKNFDFISVIKTIFDGLGNTLGNVVNVIKSASGLILPILKNLASGIGRVFQKIAGSIDGDFIENLSKIVNEGLITAIAGAIIKLITSLTSATDNAGGILEGLSGIFEGLGDTLSAFQQKIQANNLKTIATSIAILAGSLLLLSMANQENLVGAITSITLMFGELVGSLAALKELNKDKKLRGIESVTNAMKQIATAVLLLSAAVYILAKLSFGEIAKGLIAVAVGVGILVGASLLLSNFSGEAKNGAKGMMSMAIAVGILALSVKALGNMEWGQIGKGLVAFTAILAELALFLTFTDFGKIGISAGIGIMAMAVGIGILAGAIAILGNLDGMTIVKGLLAMAGTLAILAIAVNAMPPTLPLIGIGLIAISAGVLLLAGALAAMGSMSWEQIGKSLVAVAGALTILAVAVNLMNGALLGAAAMLVISAAMLVLAAALLVVSKIPWGGIVKGLVGFLGAVLVLGLAGAVLGVLSPLLLAAGAALIVFGLGVISAGTGIVALAAGIGALSVAFSTLVGSMAAVVDGIFAIGTNLLDGIKDVIVSAAGVITDGAPAIADAIVAMLKAITDIVIDGLSVIGEAFSKLFGKKLDFGDSIRSLGQFAKEIAPQLGDIVKLGSSIREFSNDAKASASGIAKLADSFKKLSDPAQKVAASLSNLESKMSGISNIGSAVVDGIPSKESDAGSAVEPLVNGAIAKVRAARPGMYSAGAYLIDGLIIGMLDNAPRLAAAGMEVGEAIKTAVKAALGEHSPSTFGIEAGMFLDMGLAIGINDFAGLAVSASEKATKASIQPIISMKDELNREFTSMYDSMNAGVDDASKLSPVIQKEEHVTISHEFEDITVRGVNDQNEFVGVAKYSVEEVLTGLMRRQSRLL